MKASVTSLCPENPLSFTCSLSTPQKIILSSPFNLYGSTFLYEILYFFFRNAHGYEKYGSLGDSSKGAAWRCPSQNVDCAPPPKAAARECHHLNYAVALKKKDCARVVILHYGKWIARLTIALHQALKCAMND